MKLTRDIYRPAGIAPAITDEALGIEVYHEGATSAKGFAGKRAKPDFYLRFRSAERRDEYIAEWIAGIKAAAERKAAQKQAAAEWRHGLKIGDIFECSWGYEQTNVDYYEVTALIGQHMVEVREIGRQAEETGFMSGSCVPAPGHYLTDRRRSETGEMIEVERPPRRMRPQRGYNGEPILAVYSFAHAHLKKPAEVAPGVKVFAPDHWTAYA